MLGYHLGARPLTLALTLALSGCAAPLKSTLVAAGASPDFAGAGAATVSADAAPAQSTALRTDLERRLARKDWGVAVQVGRTSQGELRLRVGAEEAFEPGTATLTPQALLVLSEAVSVLQAYPACVVHVLAHGADPGSDPSASLSARRAASVQSYLASRGLSPARLRAEGREAREPVSANLQDPMNMRFELVIRQVLTGDPATAWTPPRPEAGA